MEEKVLVRTPVGPQNNRCIDILGGSTEEGFLPPPGGAGKGIAEQVTCELACDGRWELTRMRRVQPSVAGLAYAGIRESNCRDWRSCPMPDKSRVSYARLKITGHIFKREMKII